MTSETEAIRRDISAIAGISAVPSLLRVICEFTGMGFAAVARVSDTTWTACAVQDNIAFGLKPGDQLELHTTLCAESRAAHEAIAFDHASVDPVYRNHHTPRIYGVESYISVPIVRRDGDYFGNLCAVDPRPAKVTDARTLTMFKLFAELIALQLESEDRRQATESALLDARSTAELREQFIAVLGHDLRNPLAAVQASAELLTRYEAQPDLVRLGTRIRSATRRMSRLIDDVLDFARGRLGAGIGLAMAEEADLGSALRDVVAEAHAAQPDRSLLERIDVGRPVVCDRGRIQQLLSNLLGNALSHGAIDAPVRVDAHIDAQMLILSVANGGEPIRPEYLEKVFEPYWRPADRRRTAGLGLGLYICAQIVATHGGTLSVESTHAHGTVFTARLPIIPHP